MDTRQPIYLLASGHGLKSVLATFANATKTIKGIGKSKPDVAFVGAASFKDSWLIYALISTFIRAGCDCRVHRVVLAPRDADLEKARAILRDADAVFISGGDVDAGMQVLRDKDMVGFFQDLARNGKLLIGASAGSIMMSKGWVRWRDPDDDSTAELFPCLGLVPFYCDTHAEEDDWVELKAALRLEAAGTTGYGIGSGACLKAHPDGRLEADGGSVARFASLDGKIERQADLLPPE